MMSLRDVSKSYGTADSSTHALVEASLDIHPGEVVALVGASGSGKSTLLLAAGGLLPPDSGEVTIDGQNVYALDTESRSALRRLRLSVIFQSYNLLRIFTALDNVALAGEVAGDSRRLAVARARELLALVGLADLEKRFPEQLSGGQQQRVAIARSMYHPGAVFLADEPTGALDHTTADLVVRELFQAARAGGGCLVATHNPEVAALADRIVRIVDGVLDTGSEMAS